MIAYVKGKLAQVEPAFAVVDVNGIGYFVKISLNTFTRIQDKETVMLHTFLQIREDAHVLYGFAEEKERMLFEQLITISGVGGNTAMVILSSISASDLYLAIRSEDINTLKRIKGIGAKTAGRIVLELKDKIRLEENGDLTAIESNIPGSQKKEEALAALASLGLAKNVMTKRVDQIMKEHGMEISTEQIIKLALRNP
ncbi:MAG: Holliday junction branch migration protein RuvA [Bacteroidia bacterium]